MDFQTTMTDTSSRLTILRDSFVTVFSHPFQLFHLNMLPLTLVILLLTVLAALIIWIIVISQIALIKDSSHLDNNGKPVKFKEIIKSSHDHFLQVLGAYVVGRWIIILLFVLIELTLGAKFLATGSVAWGVIFSLATLIIVIPLAIIISIVTKYAILYIILENKKLISSLRDGLILFGKNWLISLETLLIMGIAMLIASIITIVTPLMLAAPFFISASVWSGEMLSWFFFNTSLMVGIASFLIVATLCMSILSTFVTASWTILFKEINRLHGHQSAIIRAIKHLPQLIKKQ